MTGRLIDAAEVAAYLGHSRAWFYQRTTRAKLRAAGFPEPVPHTGRWDRFAIDRWIDAQAPVDRMLADGATAEDGVCAAVNWEAAARAAAGEIAIGDRFPPLASPKLPRQAVVVRGSNRKQSKSLI